MKSLCQVVLVAFVLAFGSLAHAQQFSWGAPGDIPVPADWDGDGTGDLAVFRPSTGQWFFALSNFGLGFLFRTVTWGTSTDIPIAFPCGPQGLGTLGLVVDSVSCGSFVAVYRPATGEWFILPVAVQDLIPF